MAARVIAIGDIHGCSSALRAIVEAIHPQPADTLVVLGDCVDRGPNSADVINQLLELREKCQLVLLLGNHEEMMLNFLDGRPQPDDWLLCGGAATVESYRDAQGKLMPAPQEHIDFIRAWGDCFETETHFFAHGSYEPDRPLSQQHWQTMRWQSLKYGIPGPHESGKTAIVGHTSQKNGQILDVGHLLCIDTFCWGGGWLTAFDPVSTQTWQADRNGRLRQP
jgi:serine/threonine protein phosphatase 1